MKLTMDQVKQKGPWVAGIGFLALLTQFDKGLDLVSRKWNADVLASEAKQAATDVRSDFDQYIQKEQEAAARQEGYIRAQQEFNENLLKLQQQQMDAPAVPDQTSWAEQDDQGTWWCCWALSYENCWDAHLWYQCPAP